MEVKEMYERIDNLFNKLKNLRPLKAEDENRLWKKFRLEWNYNSNHIEGNTLTYSHTELLLIFDKVSDGYSGREIEEMKAHDIAIKMVVDLANNNEEDLSERFIRELNRIILVRPFWKEAITQDGQQTRREITPGEYKQFANSVRLENGEIFEYASPIDTPSKMNHLMDFYRTHNVSSETHRLWLAAMLHYNFVSIHPFDDGNGRVARLLMNYVLLKYDFPPIIIKDADKKGYLTALNKADTKDFESYVIYIGEQLEWSLNKAIDAAEGKNIEDEDDFDKEISILKRNNNKEQDTLIKKSREVLQKAFNNSFENLFTKTEDELQKFNDLFYETNKRYSLDGVIRSTSTFETYGTTLNFIKNQLFFDYNKPEEFGYVGTYIQGVQNPPLEYPNVTFIQLDYMWEGYKNAGINTFNIYLSARINLTDFKFLILSPTGETLLTIFYNHPISEEEIKLVVNNYKQWVLNAIKGHLKD